MEKVIDVTNEEVIEVETAEEAKPAKVFNVLGRKITIKKAEKPAKEPKAKKNVGKKILVGAGIALATGVVAVKAIANAAAKRNAENPEQDGFQELDWHDDSLDGLTDTETTDENPDTEVQVEE